MDLYTEQSGLMAHFFKKIYDWCPAINTDSGGWQDYRQWKNYIARADNLYKFTNYKYNPVIN